MFFVFTQMWAWMLLAALAGGLIGWALRCRRCARETEALVSQRDTAVAEAKTLRGGGAATVDTDARVAELETQLSAERDEIAGLKAKLAAAAAAGVATGAAASAFTDSDDQALKPDDEIGAIQWRNRYLESRVRFLEGKLAEAEKAPPVDGEGLEDGSETQGDMDIARLKWRNRYLEGRVRYLEEDAAISTDITADVKSAKTSSARMSTAQSLVPEPGEAAPEVKPKAQKKKAVTKPKAKTSAKKPKKSETTSAAAPSVSIAGLTGAAFLSEMEKAEGYIAGDADGKPPTLTGPISGKADDLREIAGVGPKLEKLLHELGVFHFAQIASWRDEEVDWVDERLTFKGRIRRENWIDQCKLLAEGVETDGKRKYLEGKHS